MTSEIQMIVFLSGNRPHRCIYEGKHKTILGAATEIEGYLTSIQEHNPDRFISLLYVNNEHRLVVRVRDIEFIQFGTETAEDTAEDKVIVMNDWMQA